MWPLRAWEFVGYQVVHVSFLTIPYGGVSGIWFLTLGLL